jgi:type IV pilus assembly protein PilE
MSRVRGFTLVELLIVVAIMSILMAVAIPNYNEYVRRGQLIEASNVLMDWRIKLEQYYQDNRAYGPGDPACGVANPSAGATRYFTYACVTAADAGGTAGQTYTITATGIDPVAGYDYTINAANQRRTTKFANNVVAKNCWLIKGGEC